MKTRPFPVAAARKIVGAAFLFWLLIGAAVAQQPQPAPQERQHAVQQAAQSDGQPGPQQISVQQEAGPVDEAARARLAQQTTGVPVTEPDTQSDVPLGLSVEGPYVHKNLAVYFLTDGVAASRERYLPLEVAIEKGLLVIHETGNVSQLMAENLSADADVFIQAGEIVKGGRQDRTLGIDLVVPAGKKIAIPSFCVESGRWTARGGESPKEFQSAKQYLPGKELRLAAQYSKNQQEVWQGVSKAQGKLNANVQSDVRATSSGSSLQLTIEHEAVRRSSEEYVAALEPMAKKHIFAKGIVVAINGRISSVDLYESGPLFRRLFPKLLKAAAIEAVAEMNAGADMPIPPDGKAVLEVVSKAFDAPVADLRDFETVRLRTRETETIVIFDSRDLRVLDRTLHMSILTK